MSVKQLSAQKKAEQLNFGFSGFAIVVAGEPSQNAGVAQWEAKWDQIEVFHNGRWIDARTEIIGDTPSKVIAAAWDWMRLRDVWRRPDKRVARWNPTAHKVEFIDATSEYFPHEKKAPGTTAAKDWPSEAFNMPHQYSTLDTVTLDSNGDAFFWNEDDDEHVRNEHTASVLRVILAYHQAGVEPEGELAAKWSVLQERGFSIKESDDPSAMPTFEELVDYASVTAQMNKWAKGEGSW